MSAALSFDDVFASHGLFGVEVAPDVAEHVGERVTVRGYLYGPLATGPTTFVLGRAVWRACACCQGEPAWPDDVALIELREPIGSRFFRHGDPEDEVDVTGVLSISETPTGHPGLTARVRLEHADVTPL